MRVVLEVIRHAAPPMPSRKVEQPGGREFASSVLVLSGRAQQRAKRNDQE